MPQKDISRRDILKLSLVTGGAVLLQSCQKVVKMDLSVSQPLIPDASNSKMKTLVRYATLAANGHNTQPWKFNVTENTIEIHPDNTRHLAVVDPHDREQWISLGCALENLVIAARATGYASEIIYPGGTQGFICVNLKTDTLQTNGLFDAIPVRQSTRSEYRTEQVSKDILAQLYTMITEPEVEIQFIESTNDIERVLEYVNQGNLYQYADKAFVEELTRWLRFNKKEASSSKDGLFTECTGNPTVPRWLGALFVSGTKPQSQADADAKKLRSSTGVALVSTKNDTPESWVRCGQVFERLSLQMTSLELKSALLNQPIEVPELRGEFQTAMGLGKNLPQLLMRYGVADAMPYSLRRPVEEVLI